MADPDVDVDSRAIRPATRVDTAVALAMTVAVMCAVVGVVSGIAMMVHRYEVDCPDGTEFPADATDTRCFSHPHLAEGTAVVMMSVILGVLILFVGIVVRHVLDERARTVPDAS